MFGPAAKTLPPELIPIDGFFDRLLALRIFLNEMRSDTPQPDAGFLQQLLAELKLAATDARDRIAEARQAQAELKGERDRQAGELERVKADHAGALAAEQAEHDRILAGQRAEYERRERALATREAAIEAELELAKAKTADLDQRLTRIKEAAASCA